MLLSVLALIDGAVTILEQNNNKEIHLSDGSVHNAANFNICMEVVGRMLKRATDRAIKKAEVATIPDAPIPAEVAPTPEPPVPEPKSAHPVPTWETRNECKMTLAFGKYSGRTVSSLSMEDPKYISWMFNNCKLRVGGNVLFVVNAETV